MNWFKKIFKPANAVPNAHAITPRDREEALLHLVQPQARDRWLSAHVRHYTPDNIQHVLRSALAGMQLATEGLGISPVITKQSSARQLISQLCEYFDGFPILTPAGKFSLGLARKPADETSLPTIDSALLLAEPQLAPSSWSGVKTKTWIKYLDRTREYQENTIPYRAAGVAHLSGDNTQLTIERPWTTAPALAASQVAAAGRTAALPGTRGELVVRNHAAPTPGSLFKLSYPSLGITDLIMRVQTCEYGRPGTRGVTIQAALDRAYLNDAYYLPDDDEPPEPVDTTPVNFTRQTIIELPRGLADGTRITLAPLAARPNFFTTGLNVHLRKSYNLSAAQLPSWNNNFFAIGALVTAYPLTSIIDESYTLKISFNTSDASRLANLANQYRLVIQRWPSNAGIGGFMLRELMIVIGWDTAGLPAGQAKVAVIRGRLNTISGMQAAPAGQTVGFVEYAAPLVSFSYDLIGEGNRMAVFGELADSYPAVTDLIDQRTGLLVDVLANSSTLSSPSLNNAMRDELLMFVGSEIISIVTVQLQSTLRYRIWGIRARYDTVQMNHAAGEEVIVIANSDLKRLTHASFTRGSVATLKLQAKVLNQSVPLSQVPQSRYTISDRVHEPLCPINLKCLNDGHAPHLSLMTNAALAWTLRESAPRDFWGRWKGNPATVRAETILEIRSSTDSLVRTITVGPGTNSTSYSAADRIADFGMLITAFKVRAYAFENGLRSRFYSELTITVSPL